MVVQKWPPAIDGRLSRFSVSLIIKNIKIKEIHPFPTTFNKSVKLFVIKNIMEEHDKVWHTICISICSGVCLLRLFFLYIFVTEIFIHNLKSIQTGAIQKDHSGVGPLPVGNDSRPLTKIFRNR